MSPRRALLLCWLWVVLAFAAYLIQFRELVVPILHLIGGD